VKSCFGCEHRGYREEGNQLITVCTKLGYGIAIREVRENKKMCGLDGKWFEEKVKRYFWGRIKK
jgi:hypothetical protein